MPRKPAPIVRDRLPVNMLAALAVDWTIQYHQILPVTLKAIATESQKGMIAAADLADTFAREALRAYPTNRSARKNLERFLADVGRICQCPLLVETELDTFIRAQDPTWKGEP